MSFIHFCYVDNDIAWDIPDHKHNANVIARCIGMKRKIIVMSNAAEDWFCGVGTSAQWTPPAGYVT